MNTTRAARPAGTTRADLLAVGTDLILEKGYNNCGVDQILKAAGVQKGSFYYFFKNKEEFALEVVENYAAQRLGQLDRDLANTEFRHLERLRNFFEGSARRHRDRGFRMGCLFGNLGQEMADQSEAFRTRLEQFLGQYHAKIAACLRAAQAAGDLATDLDADLLAGFCLNNWEGALLRMKVVKGNEPLEAFIVVMFGTILKTPLRVKSKKPPASA